MLIGNKHERIVIEGDDLIRPYSIRPAYRRDPHPPVFPESMRIARNIAIVVLLIGMMWAAVIYTMVRL